jgi:hypothetical protein
MVIVAAVALCIHQLLAAFTIIFDDVPTESEARAAKTCRHELTSYKRNLSVTYGWPTTNLVHVPLLECILQDVNQPYTMDVTPLHGWQFFLLANYLKDVYQCISPLSRCFFISSGTFTGP